MGLKDVPRGRYERETNGTMTTCFCPKCREPHKAKVLLDGHQRLPWKYCQECKLLIERNNYELPEPHREATRLLDHR